MAEDDGRWVPVLLETEALASLVQLVGWLGSNDDDANQGQDLRQSAGRPNVRVCV